MENMINETELGRITDKLTKGPGVIIDTDSYKFSHWLQYPEGTTAMYSYLEARGGDTDKTVFFGLQYFLLRYLNKPLTMDMVAEAKELSKDHMVPFNEEAWTYMVENYGYIPVDIYAVPEGSVIPVKNALAYIVCTDPKCFWVVSWLETMFMRLYYPITVSTNSLKGKQVIRKWLNLTSDNPEAEIDFKLHDFGSRGTTTQEASIVGGLAHLVNFKGSDTVSAVWAADVAYFCKGAAYSVPASEHSIMSMWTKEGEANAYAHIMEQYSDYPIVSMVSDTWDIYNAAENIFGAELKERVIERANKGFTTVIRPDSGDVVDVIMTLLHILEKQFGVTINTKGYKVVNYNVRLLQGDGINVDDMNNILDAMAFAKFSATNIVFGMGGGLLQKDIHRDTFKFAFKCSWALINGESVPVYKDPVTDSGKKSKKGYLDLVKLGTTSNGSTLVRTLGRGSGESLMRCVYSEGKIQVLDTLDEIRERTKLSYEQHNGWVDKDVY